MAVYAVHLPPAFEGAAAAAAGAAAPARRAEAQTPCAAFQYRSVESSGGQGVEVGGVYDSCVQVAPGGGWVGVMGWVGGGGVWG